MKIKLILVYIYMLFSVTQSHAQDPDFSQFFISQQLLNPASAGTGYGDYRAMMNYRRMWGNTSTPYNTGVANIDYKFTRERYTKNILAAGVSIMWDESMYGALKSTYISTSVAYHAFLSEGHRFGVGLQGSYGNRRINQSLLTFGEQFTSGGFNPALSTGEPSLFNQTTFFSLGTGVWYNYSSPDVNFDFGVTAFHLNKPRQSLVNDGTQFIPVRMVVHSNLEFSLSASLLLSCNTVFMSQSGKNTFSIGSALGYDLGEGDRRTVLFTGVWYKAGTAIYPYLGFLYENVQVGITYDVNISKQVLRSQNPNSFEFSLIFKQARPTPGAIPCPWR